MKVHKMFCIEQDIADYLKGKNGSELVNRLLSEHINRDSIEGMSEVELKREIKIEAIKEAMEAKIKELRNGKN